EGAVIAAGRREQIDFADLFADQRPGLALPRLDELFQEQILALQRAQDLRAQRRANRPGEADQQRERQDDDVRLRLRLQPVDQLVELLALQAVLALQHRHRHAAEELAVGL